MPKELDENIWDQPLPICQDVFGGHSIFAAGALCFPGVRLKEMSAQRWKAPASTPRALGGGLGGEATPCTSAGTAVLVFRVPVGFFGEGELVYLLAPETLLRWTSYLISSSLLAASGPSIVRRTSLPCLPSPSLKTALFVICFDFLREALYSVLFVQHISL